MDESARKRINQFRVVSMCEGVSYLVLLGIAMPLKYLADMPLAVRVVGSIHGALFVAYCIALARCLPAVPLGRAVAYFIASLIPLGAFGVEYQLRKQDPPKQP